MSVPDTNRRPKLCKHGHDMSKTRRVDPKSGKGICYECAKKRSVEWSRKHPGSNRKARRRFNLKSYGLSPEQYDEMLENQGGVCSICKCKNKSGIRLAVDHDHETGAVRGLLCSLCNTAIGLLRHDKTLFSNAVEYIDSHKNGVYK